MTRRQAREYRAKIEHAAQTLSAEEAADNVMLFKPWQPDIDLVANEKVARNGNVYKVNQGHHTQADWPPESTPALFVIVIGTTINEDGEVEVDEYPAWVQPVGASDAYPIEAKVSHVGKHWKSDVANNVWEPGVYGWSEIVDVG